MLARYIPRLFYKGGRTPLYLTFFVTNRCNLKCEHCFYSAELNLPTQEMTVDEIDKMASTMDPFPVLNYSGGEPFLRDDLDDVTHAFYKHNQTNYLTIPTNGTYLKKTQEILPRMLEKCPDMLVTLNFSVDGLEEEHNRIRSGGKGGSGLFRTTMKTFDALKPLKKEYKNLRMGFITTFTATNQDQIEDVYDYLKGQGPDNVTINLIRGTPKDPAVKNIDISKFRNVTQRIKNDLMDAKLPGFDPFLAAMSTRRYDLILKTYEEKKFQTLCYASRIFGVLYPNGDVYPCEMFGPEKLIGNIRDFDMDFRKLWFSKRNKEIADWVVDTKCFCTHECNASCNISFNAGEFTKAGTRAAGLVAKKILA
ncbi:MAG: hypothetical protein CMF59_04345 [Leptospiraceae bacterium]|nr:hypothetical protein [Leptospiraceae bacterium]